MVLLQVANAALFRLHLGERGGGCGCVGRGRNRLHLIVGRGGATAAAAFRGAAAAARVRAGGARHALCAQALLALVAAAVCARGRHRRRLVDGWRGRLGPSGCGCGCRRAGRERGRRAVSRPAHDRQRTRAAGQRTVVVGQRRLIVVLLLFDVVQLLLFIAGRLRRRRQPGGGRGVGCRPGAGRLRLFRGRLSAVGHGGVVVVVVVGR